LAFFLFIVPLASAQNSYDNGTPAASKAGQSTASTYAMDKIETVNLANGNMSLHIPLVTIGGRGSASYTLALSYNSKLWSAQHDVDPAYTDPLTGDFHPALNHYSATFDDATMTAPNVWALGAGWTILAGPALKVRNVGIEPLPSSYCPSAHSEDGCGYKYVLTRLWLTLPDGSEVELRDNLTDGAPALTPGGFQGVHPSTDRDRGHVWHSTDGSAITFVTDANNGVVNRQLGGWVFLSDGTRLRIENSGSAPVVDGAHCTKIVDRNGNFVTLDYGVANPYGMTYTDELGRQTIMSSNSTSVIITVKGYSGVPDRVITIDTATIGALTSGVPMNLRADFRSLQRPFYSGDYLRTRDGDFAHTFAGPHTDLFEGSENPDAIDDHSTVTSLNLLDGRSFRFRYNQYGELAEIVYPGGGASQIDYGGFGSNFCEAGNAPFRDTLNRKVVQRRSLTDGANVDAAWIYSWSVGAVDGISYPGATVETHQSSAAGTLLASETHYFLMLDAEYRTCGLSASNLSGYEKWQNAKEFRVERNIGSGTVIEKRSWEQRASVVWANDVGLGYNAYVSEHGQEQPPNDPRVTVEDTILENGKIKRVAYTYDDFNNVTSTSEYDLGGTDGSVGAPVRQTFRTYGVNLGSNYGIVNNGLCYSNLNPADSSCGSGLAGDVTSIIHQRRLLLNETIEDGANNQKAYSELEHDNYNADTNHAGVVSNSGMIQYDGSQFSFFSSSNQPRGNVTKVSHWAGGSSYIYSFNQFDNAGNVVWAKDPKGNVSTISYTDNFGDGGTPDAGSGGTNGATYAFATLATNALGHQAKSQFDYTRGVPTGAKDPNGVISKTEYDLLGRPTRAIAAVGLSEQAIAETTYPTTSANIATASRQLDASRWLASKIILDGFDRIVTAWQAEDGQHANYASFTIRADTIYDALGRIKQVSNSYRPGAENPAYTTTTYDLSSRVLTMRTPDNSVVTTNYSGNEITVTDQAGKQRKSVTDGLGRLIQVYEDPAGLNYLTSYGYDVLDNLLTVNQDTQTRTFAYDSLKRLTSATNPESGAMCYGTIVNGQCQANGYDANGNLVYKTDARGVLTTYVYDALNRATSRSYSDGTPSVTYAYDSTTITNGKGRLASVSSSASSYSYSGYDALGRALGGTQTIGSQSYSITKVIYDRAGHVTSMRYPSGNSVNYNYDGAGRLGDKDAQLAFTGNLGDGGTMRTYAGGIVYDAASRMSQEQFGTTTPIYNKLNYNPRGQLVAVLASTSGNDATFYRGKIVNDYGTTDNNGNLKQQTVSIPNNEGNTSQTYWNQQYGYDSLNRLTSVGEYLNGSSQAAWQQSYNYDRFGNRLINNNSSATWGQGVNNVVATVDPISNQMYASGDISLPMSQRQVQYDPAGNQTKDYLTSNGTRTYDAENRMITATDSSNHTSTYTYDGDGHRVKRNISNTETWQVYGLGGELIAEYGQNGSPSTPQKEYGYRNGQLLVTADAPTGGGGPQNVTWTNAVGVSVSGNNLTKTASDGWGNSGASSTQTINSGDGYVEFTATETNNARMCGLNHSDPDQSYGIGFALGAWPGGTLYLFEAGSYSVLGSYSAGDRLKVAVEGGVVKYRKNGTLIYTSTVAPTYPLLVDSALYSNGATLTNVVIGSGTGSGSGSGGSQNVSWTSAVGVSVSGNSLTKTAADGWGNSGASSTQTISSGDGYVEFTVNETTTARMCGLNHSDPDQGYGIDFALGAWPSGILYLFEAGSYGVIGSYSAGDRLKVAVESGVVKYYQNGQLIHTSTTAPTYPLLVDTAFYSNGGTISNAVISNGSGGGTGSIHWLVTDQLGTPRMIFDQSGSLANVSRHDYLPFGEELTTQGLRPNVQGYTNTDGARQKFTQKERDNETGLDYFLARYHSSTQGRFTSPDPILISSQQIVNPQSWNLYSYVNNNPLAYLDPTGMERVRLGQHSDEEIDRLRKEKEQQIKQGKKDGTLTKEQRKQLEAERKTLGLEKEGNKLANNLINRLPASERQGLQVSDFTLTTDPTGTDFMSDPTFVAGTQDPQGLANAAGKKAMFRLRGYSQEIFINTTASNITDMMTGDRDWITYGATLVKHEQSHRDKDYNEFQAYTEQKRVLEQFGPGAFSSPEVYQGHLDFINRNIEKNRPKP